MLGLAMALPMLAQPVAMDEVSLCGMPQTHEFTAQNPQAVTMPSTVKAQAIANMPSFEAYVATYTALTRQFGNGGSQVRVGVEGDSIWIADLVITNALVKAGVHDDGTLSIPNWYTMGTMEGVGKIAFVALKKEGNTVSIDSVATEITGTLLDNGTMTFNGMFGIVTTEAETASSYYLGQDFVVQKGNATMTMNYYGLDVSFAIVAHQNGNVMTITNFGNTGLTFDAPITTDREIAIGGAKFARLKPAASFLDFMVMGLSRYQTNEDGTITPIIYDSSLKAVADGDRAVIWGLWCGTNSSGTYVVGPYLSGRIDFTEDVVYPAAPDLTSLAGSGSEEDPFLIRTTDQWLAVAANVAAGNTHTGHYFAVVNDLDFSEIEFAPIGVETGFRGVLDGRGKTITVNDAVVTSPRGLVGRLGDGGVVRNLNSAGQFDFGTAQNVGGIVGLTSKDALIENCINNANITTDGIGVGGVLGHGNSGSVVRNCKNLGTIHYLGDKSNSWLAGVVGYAQGVSLYDCGNEGQIIIDQPTKASCIGGVVSYGIYNDEFINCYNTADITGGQYVSGVMAYSDQRSLLSWSEFKGCYNTGNITSTSTSTGVPVGGVFAILPAGSLIEDCWNSGNVTTAACNSIGGVLGRNIGPAADNIERAMVLKNCYNTGDVSATAASNMTVGGVMGFGNVVAMDSCWNSGAVNSSQYIAAGVIGQIQNKSELSSVTNCYNTGEITGGNWVGGIVGNANFNQFVDNCWNAGTVKAKNRAAGIVGYSAAGAKINRSFNVGEIISTVETPGIGNNASHTIGGVAGIYAGYITDSYNAGTLTGTSRVGGVMGGIYRNANQDNANFIHKITGCYNVGKFEGALPDSCGHIVGVHMQNNGTQWREYGCMVGGALAQYLDTLENCHYLGGINPDAIIEATEEQTRHNSAQLCELNINENYTLPGAFCYPVLATQAENPYALLYAAAVVPADQDLATNIITRNFNIGAPEGMTWQSSYAGLVIDGNNATFSEESYEGEITLTATMPAPMLGKRTPVAEAAPIMREIVINVNKPIYTAVSNVTAGKAVKDVRYYNPSGMVSGTPFDGMNIQVTTYSDGSTKAAKVIK